MKLLAFFTFEGRLYNILNTGADLFNTGLQRVLLHFLAEKFIMNTV